ncbi:hypothetical protein B296_00013913 [Ensete ventricosum]|uniref:MADS-box domain-containing protein n=1 Tax=Ensete ventricosum TaxID=4639 RepID=A0A426Z3K1_ENSVE|nr:hypothetical protein B296_00013913 [Ensete ventricosum]
MFKAKKTTKGKQRIEMRKIQNKDARYISFSKRRSVFFVKASELSTLCSFDQVMNRFLSSGSNPDQSCPMARGSTSEPAMAELSHLVEAGKAREAELRGRFGAWIANGSMTSTLWVRTSSTGSTSEPGRS